MSASPTRQTSTSRTQAPPASARRGRQTALDMVRSLAVVLAIVGVVLVAAPRPQEPIRQPVDVAGAAEAARVAGAPVVVPRLPEDWTATSARFDSAGEVAVPTWHVGYLTPSRRYAGLEIARGATPAWLADATSEGEPAGTLDAAGGTWERLVSPDGSRRSLVRQRDGVTTVVTGSATLDELVSLVEAVVRSRRP